MPASPLPLTDSDQHSAAEVLEVSVRCLTRITQLLEIRPDWEALVKRAAEPNVFYEPWMLLPALEHLHPRLPIEVYAVYAGDGTYRRLAGLFPFERRRRFHGLPVSCLRSLRYHYCSLCTPLIEQGIGKEVVAALFQALGARGGVVEFNLVHAGGPVCEWLQAANSRAGTYHVKRISRAAFRKAVSPGAYLAATFRPHRYRDLRRRERRLAERGTLSYESLEIGASVDEWIEEFLMLEASGWKGEAASALAARPNAATYFRKACRAAHDRNRLQMHALRFNEKAIAQTCLFEAGDGLYAFRIAYDEAYARHSPGVLLAVWHSCQMHQHPYLRWIDSCSDPGNPLVNQIWRERVDLLSFRFRFGTWPLVVLYFVDLGRQFADGWRRRVSIGSARAPAAYPGAADSRGGT
jgi:CelD/BcsL family acetyltransferase involved in cellulose biosynthesis